MSKQWGRYSEGNEDPTGQMVCGFGAGVIAACCTLATPVHKSSFPRSRIRLRTSAASPSRPTAGAFCFPHRHQRLVRHMVEGRATGVVTPFKVSDQPDFRGGVYRPHGQWLVFRSQRDATLRRVRVSGGERKNLRHVVRWCDGLGRRHLIALANRSGCRIIRLGGTGLSEIHACPVTRRETQSW